MRLSLLNSSARICAGLILLLCCSCSSLRAGVQKAYNDNIVGHIANELVGTRWVPADGARPTVAYSGRYTVLVFFDPDATATKSCAEELVALHAEFQDRGVAFFGVTDCNSEKLGFFLESSPLPFPVLTESPRDRLNFRIKKLYQPEVFVVDPYQRVAGCGIESTTNLLRQRL
ncbi:MAG: hypothetical protein ACI8QS_001238 [Planctomycetota bacterium]|jgi:hypothetical protein